MKVLYYGLLSFLPLACLAREGTNASAPPQLLITNLPPVRSLPPDGSRIEKGFAVKNAGSLFLTFPRTWRDSILLVPEKDKIFDAVKFVPPRGDEFAALVEVINVGGANAERIDIRDALDKAGQAELTNAVEKSLDIRDFQGPQMTGCYFVITDKSRTIAAPRPGQYLYLTQGYAKVGRLILSFRLVSNHLSPFQEDMLEMMKSVRFVRK